MGKCQSQVHHEPEIVLTIQNETKLSSIQSMKVDKNHPSQDFATPVNETPKLTKQAQEQYNNLGPFNYQKCGKYKQGIELGPYKLRNGAVYVGQWLDGKTNGKGQYYLPDHSLFEGISVENEIQGYGRIIHANGDYFEGQVKKSKANGQGTYVEGNITYKGNFRDNLQHGQGVQFSDLYQFRGIYRQGQKYKGTLTLKNQQKYEYNGDFKNNKFHGYGILTNDVGKYEGRFQNGKKDGFGKFTWADGSFFQGLYKNDQKHGQGKLYNRKGLLIRQGIWQQNNIKP